MRRALVWTVVGIAVLGSGVVAILRLGATPGEAGAPPVVAAAAPPATPAPRAAARPTPAPSGVDGAAAVLPEPAAVQRAPDVEGALAAVGAERRALQAGIREQAHQRAKERREVHERRRAAHRAAREQWEAARAPDPNRPPPVRERLHLGPAIIPAPARTAAE